MKRIIVSVINDLVTDQRVHKSCQTLMESGYSVHLVGRNLPHSLPMDSRSYSSKRMKLLFTKGPVFYAFFNIRLFLYLLFQKADGLHSNDLDTLLANFLISKIKRIPLVYDSHEYFTEVPELQGRFAQKVWKYLEKKLLPKLDVMITVNDSIANLYSEQRGKKVHVLRNLPKRKQSLPTPKSRTDYGISKEEYLVLIQGAGINVDRGAEEAVESMRYLDGVKLLIIGGGDVMPILKGMVKEFQLQDKVIFMEKKMPKELPSYTAMADLGLSLDKDTNLNYRFSLPNKIFDYISCGVPVLSSQLPEVLRIVDGYELGLTVSSHNPHEIANAIAKARDNNLKVSLADKMIFASKSLCWETESITLAEIWNKKLPHA